MIWQIMVMRKSLKGLISLLEKLQHRFLMHQTEQYHGGKMEKNMLGFDVLVEIADYYEVEIRKILDGERKGKNMNKEMEDTVLKVADYTNTEAQNHNKRVHRLFLFAIVFYVLTLLFEEYVAYIGIDFLEGFSEGFLKGGMLGIILVVFFITGRYGKRMRDFKLHILHKIKK